MTRRHSIESTVYRISLPSRVLAWIAAVVAIAAALGGLTTTVSADPPLYLVENTGLSQATALNNSGTVGGSDAKGYASIWDAVGGLQRIPLLAASPHDPTYSSTFEQGAVTAINGSGQIAGTMVVGQFIDYSTLTLRGISAPFVGTASSIQYATDPRYTQSGSVTGIDAKGNIVGSVGSFNNNALPGGSFYRDSSGTFSTLAGRFPTVAFPDPLRMSDNGQVLMTGQPQGAPVQGGVTFIGDPKSGAVTPSGFSGIAETPYYHLIGYNHGADVNNSGAVVGSVATAFSFEQGGLFTEQIVQSPAIWQNGTLTMLDRVSPLALYGGDELVQAINNHGISVGLADQGSALYWDTSGHVFNLQNFLDPAAGATLHASNVNINDVGQILVSGSTGGRPSALLLDPLAPGTATRLLAGTNVGGSIFSNDVQGTFADITGPGGLFYGDPLKSVSSLPGPLSFHPIFDQAGEYGFDLHFTGAFNGPVDLSFAGLARGTHLYHFVGNQWVDLGNQFDTNGLLTASTTSFSPFAFGTPLAPGGAVPEPSSMALLGMGALGLLGGWHARKKRVPAIR